MTVIQSTIVISLLIFVTFSDACHPQCSYACDDPVCPAECHAQSSKPKCTVSCNNSFVPIQGQCNFKCSNVVNITNVCESDSCPLVETLCTQLICIDLPRTVTCTVLCEAPTAGWVCNKPKNCRQPICELQCEKPACEYSNGTRQICSILFIFIVNTILKVFL